jgi:hypothetical protein
MPVSPVPALALPELMSSARGGCCDRCCFASVTGAAQKAFLVKLAAQVDDSSVTKTTRSSLPFFLMPAATAASRIPAIGNISSDSAIEFEYPDRITNMF